MALEIECKYCDVDFDLLRGALTSVGARACGRHFEQNTLFDTDPPTLSGRHMLLRLRLRLSKEQGGETVVTLKRPAKHMKHVRDCKILDEREVVVADARAFRRFLEGLGYRAFARYEKIREVWHFDAVEIALDTLPFGTFVEIEGDRDAIARTAEQLHLTDYPKSTQSYHVLHQNYAKRQGILHPTRSFIFDEPVRAAWCERLGIPYVAEISL